MTLVDQTEYFGSESSSFLAWQQEHVTYVFPCMEDAVFPVTIHPRTHVIPDKT